MLGTPIRAVHVGSTGTQRAERVLVVGCIHGNESAGIAVVRVLARMHPGLDLLLVPDLNPDGVARGTRGNAHGVDLNRNFPAMWARIGRPGSPQYAGPAPLSEPESRAAAALIRRFRPQISIWFHQPQAVVRAWGPSVATARRYARLAGAPFRALAWPNGTAANWQNHLGQISFVVELPAGPLSAAAARRYARAVVALPRP